MDNDEKPETPVARSLSEGMANEESIKLLRSVAERWKNRSLQYAVVNGLDDYPDAVGRDIDVVTDPSQVQQASDIICQVVGDAGWDLALRRRSELLQHIAVPRTRGRSLIIDLFPGLRWGPAWLVQRPSPTHCVDLFPIDPWASFVKRVLLHVLVAPVPKFRGRLERLHLTREETSIAGVRLPDLVGPNLTAQLLRALDRQDLARLQDLRRPLRQALVRSTFWKHPVRACRTSAQWARARVEAAIARPAMPIVGVVAVAGVDASSVLREVVRQAKDRMQCSRVETRSLRHCAGISRGPSRDGVARAVYRAIDTVFSYFGPDRRISADLGFLLYEWSCTDPQARSISSAPPLSRLLRAPGRPAPRLDLLVVLHAASSEPDGFTRERQQAEHKPQAEPRTSLADREELHLTVRDGASAVALGEQIGDRIVELFLRRNVT